LKQNGGFTRARFTRWWKLEPPADSNRAAASDKKRGNTTAAHSPKPATDKQARSGRSAKTWNESLTARAAVIAARLDTGDPAVVARGYGRGRVLLTAFPLDADGSTLPAKPDYVPFLHEMLFHLASARSIRNVDVGTPLVLPIAADFPVAGFAFYGPDQTAHTSSVTGEGRDRFAELLETRLPGVYVFRRTGDHEDKSSKTKRAGKKTKPSGRPTVGKPAGDSRPEFFVVNFDRAEADLTPLDAAAKELLRQQGGVEFAKSSGDLKQKMFADTSKSELWRLLLLMFLGLLVFETVMTRRLVRGGHMTIDDAEPAV